MSDSDIELKEDDITPHGEELTNGFGICLHRQIIYLSLNLRQLRACNHNTLRVSDHNK